MLIFSLDFQKARYAHFLFKFFDGIFSFTIISTIAEGQEYVTQIRDYLILDLCH